MITEGVVDPYKERASTELLFRSIINNIAKRSSPFELSVIS